MTELKRGLGRGLSALLGEPVRTETPKAANAPAWAAPAPEPRPAPPPIEPPRNVFELPVTNAQPQAPAAPAPQAPRTTDASDGPRSLPIDLVQRNPQQPRKHFDESDLTELAGSIRTHGVLQPILVRPIADGKYEIVAGERRWRAAQRAGLHTIPAVIRVLDEVEVLEIAIVENVQRTDLNPIEEAHGFQALIDRFGRTQEVVRDGRLSSGHARAILTAPDQRALAQRAIKEGLNVREVERLAQQAKDEKHGPRVTTGGDGKSADTRALEQSLSNALGLEVTISEKSGTAGEVKISYKSLEQLDDVIRRLQGGF